MNKIKALLLLLVTCVTTTSCTYAQKQQEATNKTFPIGSFTSVDLDIVGNVIYNQSNNTSVRAQGDKVLVDKLIIKAENGKLKIDFSEKVRTKGKKELTVHVSSPSIEMIDVDGVGNFEMEGTVEADNFKIHFDGVGNFKALALQCKTIKIDAEGVGNITLGGVTDFIDLDAEGVGSVKTEQLKAKTAVVKSSGVGSVKCYASESIDISNSGVGSVSYYGNPKTKNINNSGIGKIRAR